jgi:N-carbamoylputrescine amidase
VSACAGAGANVVFLPELTLSRYPADSRPEGPADAFAEDMDSGPSLVLARELARDCDVHVQISLFERSGAADQRGLNTSIIVAPNGECLGRTRKLHIPVTEGYFEDHYFTEGPADDPYPVHNLELDGVDLKVGNPTCWDEWFPEVARCYALSGADVLCYPTAIGSEPDYPDFDTAPLLRRVVTGHAAANGLFIALA